MRYLRAALTVLLIWACIAVVIGCVALTTLLPGAAQIALVVGTVFVVCVLIVAEDA